MILSFCVGNDLTENRKWARREDDPSPQPPAGQRSGAWDALERHSRLFQAWRSVRKQAKSEGLEKFHGFVRRRMRLARAEFYEQGGGDAVLERTLAEIERMRDFAGAAGGGFAVFLLPDEYQFDAALRDAALAGSGESALGIEPRLVQRRLTPRLTDAGITVIDPFEAFAGDYTPGRYYIPRDTHLNAEGNRVAAEAILGFVLERYEQRIRKVTGKR